MILCCGEALIDFLPETHASGRPCFTACPGGAVFNTAVALGRLGAEVELLSGLSEDIFGGQLRAALRQSHVRTSYAPVRALPTTLAFIQLLDGNATYAFFDENTASRMLLPVDLPASLPAGVTTLFLGGISLATEPCADTLVAFAERHAGQCIVMVDLNIRPNFIKNEATYRKRLKRLISIADIVKVSDDDIDWLYPDLNSEEANWKTLEAEGPTIVLITRGAKGADAISNGAVCVSLPAQDVTIVDTVGAGDTFNAGFLTGLSKIGMTSKTALKAMTADELAYAMNLGIRAAAVTVSRLGADPPWWHELAIQAEVTRNRRHR
ncbi:fructokinase [Martelella mediterranea]|uniref:Fructokinase n=2 Tax=Martelella mediterranea TaxID=293089 RepID=A0A4R3NGN3_9HYPH|nr:fructokinase [Martelella mediterranea]